MLALLWLIPATLVVGVAGLAVFGWTVRSGQYEDHRAIIAHLETVEGFAEARIRFDDRAFRSQLDKLCAMAQEPKA